MEVFVSWRDITYEPLRSAGTGGIAKVFVAVATTGPNKGTLFAVKVFTPNSEEKKGWRRDFMREVHVLRDCNHPSIVRVFDEGDVGDGRLFFVMEYLPTTLWQAMQDSSLTMAAKVGAIMQLLSALDYLSRRDPYIVHRDIKPKNIFLKAETCVLGDFGLVFQDIDARPVDRSQTRAPAMAQKYRTPELVEYQISGKKPPPASDVFQLGLVATELFTGKNPLRHGGPKRPVELEALAGLPGTIGEILTVRIEEMIVIETVGRKSANVLLPFWMDLYRAVNRREAPRLREPILRESGSSRIKASSLPSTSSESAQFDDFAAGIYDSDDQA